MTNREAAEVLRRQVCIINGLPGAADEALRLAIAALEHPPIDSIEAAGKRLWAAGAWPIGIEAWSNGDEPANPCCVAEPTLPGAIAALLKKVENGGES